LTAREILLNFLGNKCQICGSDIRLELHHVDKNRSNNEIQNIKLLCKKCHVKAHHKIKKKKGNNIEIDFTNKEWAVLEKFRGLLGNSDSEVYLLYK